MAGVGSLKAGGAYVAITLDDTRLVQGLKMAQRKLKAFGKSLFSFGKQISMVGSAAVLPMGIAVKQFANFDDQMRLVQAVTGATDKDFKTLTARAKELSRTTSYTAKQIAEGMVALFQMGFSAKETENAISDFMNLDMATGMGNIGASAKIAENAMRSFGMTTADTGRIADVLTATANMSAQTLSDVGEALKKGASNAHMANATLEDTCSMLGVLANLGIRGSMAGNAIAKTFERLSSGSGVDVLKRWGIDPLDSKKNLRPMREILLQIANVTKKMGSAEKISFLTDVFDVRGAKGGGLISGNMKALDEIMNKIASSEGIAGKTAKKMDSGIGGALKRLQSGLDDVSLTIGEIIAEYIQPFTENISSALNVLAQWIAKNKQFVIGAVKVTATLATAGAAATALGAALSALVSTPVLGTAAIVTGIYGIYKALQQCVGRVATFKQDMQGLMTIAKDVTAVIGGTFRAALQALSVGNMEGVGKVFKTGLRLIWLEATAPLRNIWAELMSDMQMIWIVMNSWLQENALNCWHGITSGLNKAGDVISKIWRTIWDGVLNSFDKSILFIRKGWNELKGLFSGGDVNAMNARLENEYTQRVNDRANASRQAQEARNNKMLKIERDREPALELVRDERDEKIAEQARRMDADRNNAMQEIEQARQEWLKSVEEIKAKAAEGSADGVKVTGRNLKQQLAGVDVGASGELNSKTSAVGSFSAGALNAILGNDTAMTRTAKATERMADAQSKSLKYQERTAKGIENLQDGGLVYA